MECSLTAACLAVSLIHGAHGGFLIFDNKKRNETLATASPGFDTSWSPLAITVMVIFFGFILVCAFGMAVKLMKSESVEGDEIGFDQGPGGDYMV